MGGEGSERKEGFQVLTVATGSVLLSGSHPEVTGASCTMGMTESWSQLSVDSVSPFSLVCSE
jgi:hypothetical protein